jgi:hypothetical protein
MPRQKKHASMAAKAIALLSYRPGGQIEPKAETQAARHGS